MATANAGYHAYATGDVLTAAQVQYNLQNQTTMYFASASARTTALTGVLVEGMVSYIPANGIEYYNGSAWVSISQAVTALTTKGDLLTYSTQDTRLPVGSDGQILIADSTATTGLRWQGNYAPGKNPTLNSAFQVWQRYSQPVTGTITAATAGTTTAYVVTNTFVVGQYVTVTGMTPTTLNGAGVVTVASGSGFTIAATTTGVFSAGGTATGSPYTSVAASSIPYTADRWQIATGANEAYTVSRQATGDTTNLPNIQYCARVQRNSGQTGTTAISFVQSFESVNSIPFAGKSVAFSFYARAGANFSGVSATVRGVLATGTGTDQNRLTAVYTGETQPIVQDAILTTTWQRFTGTGTVPATATEIGIVFTSTPTGTAGTNDYFEITGIQLEASSVASAFSTNGATYQAELAACQRYLPAITTTASQEIATGYSQSTNNAIYQFYFAVPARIPPTGISLSGSFSGYALNTGYSVTPTFNTASSSGSSISSGSGITITAGQGSRLATSGVATILFTGSEL